MSDLITKLEAAAEGSRELIGVCSNRPRPSVQKGAKGNQFWTRDVYHFKGDGRRTLCGRDTSDWLTIGPMQVFDDNACKRCVALLRAIHDQQGAV